MKKDSLRKIGRETRPWLYSSLSLFAIFLVVVFPIGHTVYLSFTNMGIYNYYDYTLIGIENYVDAFSLGSASFLRSLGITILWTAVNMVLQLVIAYVLAVLLNSPHLKGRKVYKALLMIPWAMPGYVSILLWKNGMFNGQFGYFNKILSLFGAKADFLSNDVLAFVSCTIVNLWLALPFMIMIIDGALQSVNKELFESASLDGCNAFEKHLFVSIPSIVPIIAPAVLITLFTTFKQFDIINLMTISPVGTGAHIETVIVYAYQQAFITGNYGYSGAVATIIFVLVVLSTVFFDPSFRKKGAKHGAK